MAIHSIKKRSGGGWVRVDNAQYGTARLLRGRGVRVGNAQYGTARLRWRGAGGWVMRGDY